MLSSLLYLSCLQPILHDLSLGHVLFRIDFGTDPYREIRKASCNWAAAQRMPILRRRRNTLFNILVE